MRRVLAAGVLLGGVAAALLFRRASPPADPPAPGVSERLVLRRPVAPSSPPAAGPARSDTRKAQAAPPAPAPKKTPAILAPMDPGQPPPALARTYPHSRPIEGAGFDTPASAAPPQEERPPPAARLHRIVDGDTLEGLAQRYLGSADRAGEIYEANRDVLLRPDILPIGAELKIPPRGPHAGTPSQAIPRRPLGPIPSVR